MSEITERCHACMGSGVVLVGNRSPLTHITCPVCKGSGEIDPDPPACASCGKALKNHIGHEGLCRQLEEAKRLLMEANEHLRAHGCSEMPKKIDKFLKELES